MKITTHQHNATRPQAIDLQTRKVYVSTFQQFTKAGPDGVISETS
jgi:hypothetical protein